MKPFKFSKKKREYIKWSKNVTEVRTIPEAPRDAGQTAPLQMDMDGGGAQGIYANLAAVTHTETEFVLDFLFLQPDRPKARVGTRVISSPVHTKRLCAALRENLKVYEARFGPVKG
jgi:hypothetical protein